MNISYTRKGDYLLPNLILENKEQYNIRKYGLLRLDYIKNNKKSLYYYQHFKTYLLNWLFSVLFCGHT